VVDPLDGDDVTVYRVKDPVSGRAGNGGLRQWPPATTGSSLVVAEEFGHDVFV
jgi:hypothetical protein